MKKAIVKYSPKLPKLTTNQQKVLDLLCEAGEHIASIYELQENDKFPGANFYPHDVSKEEIEKAAKKDPKILSPYTIVERKRGELIAIPYHEKYAELLKPISKKLFEAAQIIDNTEYAKALTIQAEVLLDGNYDKAVTIWMRTSPYLLDLNIGPIERYDDKLFFIKTSYQAWVGVMDEEITNRLIEYKNLILNSQRKAMVPSERVNYFDKIQTSVDDLLLLSGLIARTLFSGVNLPNDPNLVEKYGSRVTLFKQTNRIRHENNMIIFNKLFCPQFKRQFSSDDLEKGSLSVAALHEYAHSYLRYRNAEKRLNDLFPVIDELAATVMGIKVCGTLLLKDAITQHEVEAIMLAGVLRGFHNVINDYKNSSMYHYHVGWAILINYLIESGALMISDGISWPNFMKIFISVDQLSVVLEKILSKGTRADAEVFIKKYGDFSQIHKIKKEKNGL